jgi:ribosomal protein L37AE/L43A
MKRTALPCPVCRAAVELRVYLGFIGVFDCHVCGTAGYGPVWKHRGGKIKDGDIVIREPRDADQ